MTRRPLILLMSLPILSKVVTPCSWTIGYFRQVTHLRGTIVGVNDGDWRRAWRWARQRVVRADALLRLYKYQRPLPQQRPVLAEIHVDRFGAFDFGGLPSGHYTLEIEFPGGGDSFDVEVTKLPRPTQSVTIDVSPVFPDCSGGHEFIIKYGDTPIAAG